MIDQALVEKKLAFIGTCVCELRDLCAPERIGEDVRETRFAEHTLQIAIQAALDVASHVVSTRRLGEPRTNRQTFDLLARAGVVGASLAESLYAMAEFRNLLVLGYQDVDAVIVRELVEERLSDLLAFVTAIRALDQARRVPRQGDSLRVHQPPCGENVPAERAPRCVRAPCRATNAVIPA